MGEHIGEDDEQDRPDARQREDRRQPELLPSLLAGKIGHLGQNPEDQEHRQPAHHAEGPAPAQQRAEESPRRDAERKRQRRSDHGDRDRAALQMVRHHAGGIAGRQRPEQPRAHARDETGDQRDGIAVGDGRHRVDDGKAADRDQQQRAPPPVLRGDRQGNGGDERADRIGGDELADQCLGSTEAPGHLREQARWQDFREERDEGRHRERQQAA